MHTKHAPVAICAWLQRFIEPRSKTWVDPSPGRFLSLKLTHMLFCDAGEDADGELLNFAMDIVDFLSLPLLGKPTGNGSDPLRCVCLTLGLEA